MPFNLSEFYKHLKTTFVSGTFCFETIDSTNNYLKEHKDLKTGELIIAETQTAGRGRRGREWKDNPSENLLFSFSYIPRNSIENPGVLSLLCALSLNRVCRKLLGDGSIKWPNDVKIGNRKIAGILLESKTVLTKVSYIVGIGVNVNQVSFDDELKTTATSFYQQLGDVQSREKLLALIMNEIASDIKKLENDKWTELINEYSENCETLKKKISFEIDGQIQEGTALSINPDGSIVINSNGVQVAYHGNEISYIKVL